MLQVRLHVLRGASKFLASSVTIAIRYSHYRMQFGKPERAVINYQMQQHKLLGALASTFAMMTGSNNAQNVYDSMIAQIQTPAGLA